MRLKLLLAAFFVSITFSLYAADEPQVYKYWVQLKDKAKSPYSVNKPEVYLSQKAIERRKKNGIAITEQDFPVNPNYLAEIRKIKGVTVLNTSRWFNTVTVAVEDDNVMIKFDKLPFVVNSKLLSITKKPAVEYGDRSGTGTNVLPPPPLHVAGDSNSQVVTGDAEMELSHYGKAERQIEMLNGIKLHALGYTGKGVSVAVIDAGFAQANQLVVFRQAVAAQQILATWDFVMGNEWVYDDSQHGTGVLSCMLGNLAGKMVGTAPDASYYLLRSEDEHTEFPIEESNWVSAAEYADSAGVDIINSSLGYTQYDDTLFGYSYENLDGKTAIITRAADMAADRGIIVCNAAGNSGIKQWKYIGAPADAEKIITVAAVDSKKERAFFSSFGPTADGRMKPDMAAMGEATIVANTLNQYKPGNGTSYASPVLCGMVACLVQANPTAPSADIINAIEKSCDNYPLANPEVGYGIPDFYLAHTMLGKSVDFDYTTSQMVEFRPDYINKEYLIYNFYSATEQTVTIEIYKKKTLLLEFTEDYEAGSFNKHALKQFNNLEKDGTLTFIMKDKKGRILAEKEFEK